MLKLISHVSDVFPEVLKSSSPVSDVFPKVIKLSSEVSECKPLLMGEIELDSGWVHVGETIQFGYYSQAGPYTRPLLCST